jgi:hypothetical protein
MKKTCNVVMLPTEKAKLGFNINGELVTGDTELHSNDYHKAQHIYITSNDEIKEGDWYIGYLLGEIVIKQAVKYYGHIRTQWLNNGQPRIIPELCEPAQYWSYSGENYQQVSECKKIVATTDKNLTFRENNIWGQKGTGVYLDIAQIPESFIKAFVESNGTIKEVELEMEQYFDECPDIKDVRSNIKIKTTSDNTVIVH